MTPDWQDRIEALMADWRRFADVARKGAANAHLSSEDRRECEAVAQTFTHCADQLEALIAVQEPSDVE